jgi:GGDEF domain-containing protein
MNTPNNLGPSQLPTAHVESQQFPKSVEKHEIMAINRNLAKLALGQPIEDNARLEEGWQRATHDQLSPDMLNREGLREWFERYRPQKAAVFLLDAVGFKAINDTFGQFAGDEVVKGVGTELLKRFRTSKKVTNQPGERRENQGLDRVGQIQDTAVARIGGDEWLAVINLDGVPDDKVAEVTQSIKDRITEPAKFEVRGEQIQAQLRAATMTPDDTKDLSIEAIYQRLSDVLVQEKAKSKDQ